MNHLDKVQATPLPERMRRMKRDKRGYPVPFFAWIDPKTKEPDFRTLNPAHVHASITSKKCGICGDWLKPRCYWFIGGPKLYEYRVSVDLPMHEDCARYALEVCPFLALPSLTYTRSGPVYGAQIIEAMSTDKPEIFMLGEAAGFQPFQNQGHTFLSIPGWLSVFWHKPGTGYVPAPAAK